MPKTANINVHVEPALKKEAEDVFKELGISETVAVNLFYRQVAFCKGLPFNITISRKTAVETVEKTDRWDGLTGIDHMDDLLKDLDLEKEM
ncbi:MAG: type II toxin-antitoxin system RelB/DinJ family antitoxin [Candidatus Magnetominusculus sp. LBB02]|nr:type II toxin-antitoxin system RelB/DinJ family antitoxin [Candidatus Magnetominusculus sp. LBB02]